MPFPGNPPPRIKILSGWRAVIFAVSILAIIAVLAFVAFGVLVIVAPILIVAAAASLFLPKSKIVVFRRTSHHADCVIDAEYKVIEPTQIERKDGASFDQSDEAR
jgi:hypothetical protein